MKAIPGLEFTVLHCGWVEKDMAVDFNMHGLAEASNRNPQADWWRTPCLAVLFRHPQAGYILLDGGACRGSQYGGGRRPAEAEQYTPLYVQEGQWIEQQLALCGIAPRDLSMVILSNFHWDRVGVLEHLAGCPAAEGVLVPEADFGYGLVETHKAGQDAGLRYLYQDFKIPGITYRYMQQEDDGLLLAPGLRLLVLQGNAPATLGLLAATEAGSCLFPCGAMPAAQNLGPPALPTGISYDTLAFQSTARRLGRLAAEEDAALIYSHDPATLKAWKAAPHWQGGPKP